MGIVWGHSIHPTTLFRWRGGGATIEPPTKGGGGGELTEKKFLEGVAGKEGVRDLFQSWDGG